MKKNLEIYKHSADNLLRYLSIPDVDLKSLSEACKTYISNCKKLVTESSDEDLSFKRRMEFQWSQSAKGVALLLRNILFRIYRDTQYHADQKIELSVIHSRNQKSAEVFTQANEELFRLYNTLNEATEKNVPENKKWKHYNTPLSIFSDQMSAVIEQIDLICKAQEILNNDREAVTQLHNHYENMYTSLTKDFDNLKSYVNSVRETVSNIQDVEDKNNINLAKATLKKAFEQIDSIKDSYQPEKKDFKRFQDDPIPIDVFKGELIIKQISILGLVSTWIENNIYPSIFEAGRSIVLTCDNILVSLINVQNRLNLSTTEQSLDTSFNKSSILEPMELIGIDPEKLYDEIRSSIQYTDNKFKDNIIVCNVFEKSNLLFKDQYAMGLSQYKMAPPKWVGRLPVDKVHKFLKNLYRQFLGPSIGLESTDDVIEFIDKKIIHSLDQYNHSLFLNKGFLGKSFIVDRPTITGTIKNNLNSWSEGFRGSSLIYGSRLSGKSTILESIYYSDLNIELVRLKPNKIITFQGRKHHTAWDLSSSIAFVDKNAYHKKVILIIDDLELWRDNNYSLYDNVKGLLEFMGRSYKRIFFLVSTNNWSKDQLDKYLNFSDQFVSSASCDNMPEKEMQRALLIRHGATMEELIYKESEQLDKSFLHRQTLDVAKKSRGNIGTSLFNWCKISFSSYLTKEDLSNIPDKLVTIIKDNYEILLYILRCHHTNEAELTKSVGSRFVKEISSDIQKLISYKLLVRHTDGGIKINEYLVSEIEAVMRFKSTKILVNA